MGARDELSERQCVRNGGDCLDDHERKAEGETLHGQKRRPVIQAEGKFIGSPQCNVSSSSNHQSSAGGE